MNFTDKILSKDFFFFAFFILVIIGILTGTHTLYGKIQPDEVAYQTISSNFNKEYLTNYTDTKPIFFLSIEKLLNADIIKTRGLNLILIVLISFVLYDLTKNKLAFLFIFIPIFLTSMWLTVEITEVLFILLSFKYQNKSGWFIGLATAFRPYSAVYFFLLNKKQRIQFIIVGIIAISIMFYFGILQSYILRLFSYGSESGYDIIGWSKLSFLAVWLWLGISNYRLWKWQILSLIPLYFKMYDHYFLTPYTLLFLGYLLNKRSENDINNRRWNT